MNIVIGEYTQVNVNFTLNIINRNVKNWYI